MKIITDQEVLRRYNEDVKHEEIKSLIKDLEESLAASERPGVGLAASQIGINKRACIVRLNGEEKISLDLINPIIVERYDLFINKDEGCLSLPNQRVNTKRFKEIVIKDDLHPAGIIATDFLATVIQHEVDHCNSILIIDNAMDKKKIGRNDPCPCGRIKNDKPVKYKKCHGK